MRKCWTVADIVPNPLVGSYCQRSNSNLRFIIIVIVAYLLGSIPFGFLIVRVKAGADIRESGSGGTGATNVSRRVGIAGGVITLLLDALKGAIAVLVATKFSSGTADWLIPATAVAVLTGHIFPIWLGFHGGKGVATAIGVFLVLAPTAVAIAGIVFVITVWITRYVSFGSILGAITVPIVLLLEQKLVEGGRLVYTTIVAAIACAALIIFAHRQNISRLIQGNENKFKH